MISQWFIRTFRKRVAVRVFLALEDKRIIERWIVPKLNSQDLDIKGIGVYKMTNEGMYLTSKNVPTYNYDVNSCEPVILSEKAHQSYLTPSDYATALNSKVIKEALDATKGNGIEQSTIILGVIMILGFLAIIYLQNQGFSSISDGLLSLGIGG